MEKFHQRNRSAENVCLNNIVKSIKCDHPCSEGYEAGNLISNNFMERSKGFLVERFIKPPVTITFEFSCEINLKYIIVVCNVGAQKSSGIELSINSSTLDKQYEPVTSGVLRGNEKGFVFHRYNENVRAKFGEQFCFRSFKSSRNLSVVKSARVKIFRTDGSSVPALGRVEIWGVPSQLVPKVKSNGTGIKSQHMTQVHQHSEVNEGKQYSLKAVYGNRPSSSQCGRPQCIKVPEDFIDPITCEIMCQPVTLPSGKVIDITTLELHEKAESKWGRGPSDPFTGIQFTISSKPVAASDLKARIDKFLCDNSDNPEFHKIPRTVGMSCVSAQKPSISKLIHSEGQISNQSFTNNSLPTYNSHTSENPVKRRKVEEDRNQDCNIQSGPTKIEISSNPHIGVENAQFSCTKKKPTFLSFQERMEKSLEISLRSTLSNLPSFTTNDKKCNDGTKVECNVCKLCDNLFSIPCCHFICRNCLVSFKRKAPLALTCTLCKHSFQSHDVQKVHLNK